MCALYTRCPEKSERGDTRVTDACGCWESNLGPVREQGLLTAEPSLISNPRWSVGWLGWDFLRSGVLFKD